MLTLNHEEYGMFGSFLWQNGYYLFFLCECCTPKHVHKFPLKILRDAIRCKDKLKTAHQTDKSKTSDTDK